MVFRLLFWIFFALVYDQLVPHAQAAPAAAPAPSQTVTLEQLDAIVREAGSFENFIAETEAAQAIRQRYLSALQKYFGNERPDPRSFEAIVRQMRIVNARASGFGARMWETTNLGESFTIRSGLRTSGLELRADNWNIFVREWGEHLAQTTESYRRNTDPARTAAAIEAVARRIREFETANEARPRLQRNQAAREFYESLKRDSSVQNLNSFLFQQHFASEQVQDMLRSGDADLVLDVLERMRTTNFYANISIGETRVNIPPEVQRLLAAQPLPAIATPTLEVFEALPHLQSILQRVEADMRPLTSIADPEQRRARLRAAIERAEARRLEIEREVSLAPEFARDSTRERLFKEFRNHADARIVAAHFTHARLATQNVRDVIESRSQTNAAEILRGLVSVENYDLTGFEDARAQVNNLLNELSMSSPIIDPQLRNTAMESSANVSRFFRVLTRRTPQGAVVPLGTTATETNFVRLPRRLHGAWEGAALGECVGGSCQFLDWVTPERWAVVTIENSQRYHLQREGGYQGFVQLTPVAVGERNLTSVDFGAPAFAGRAYRTDPNTGQQVSTSLYELWVAEQSRRLPPGSTGLVVGESNAINNAGALDRVRTSFSYLVPSAAIPARNVRVADPLVPQIVATARAEAWSRTDYGKNGQMIFDATVTDARSLHLLDPSSIPLTTEQAIARVVGNGANFDEAAVRRLLELLPSTPRDWPLETWQAIIRIATQGSKQLSITAWRQLNAQRASYSEIFWRTIIPDLPEGIGWVSAEAMIARLAAPAELFHDAQIENVFRLLPRVRRPWSEATWQAMIRIQTDPRIDTSWGAIRQMLGPGPDRPDIFWQALANDLQTEKARMFVEFTQTYLEGNHVGDAFWQGLLSLFNEPDFKAPEELMTFLRRSNLHWPPSFWNGLPDALSSGRNREFAQKFIQNLRSSSNIPVWPENFTANFSRIYRSLNAESRDLLVGALEWQKEFPLSVWPQLIEILGEPEPPRPYSYGEPSIYSFVFRRPNWPDELFRIIPSLLQDKANQPLRRRLLDGLGNPGANPWPAHFWSSIDEVLSLLDEKEKQILLRAAQYQKNIPEATARVLFPERFIGVAPPSGSAAAVAATGPRRLVNSCASWFGRLLPERWRRN